MKLFFLNYYTYPFSCQKKTLFFLLDSPIEYLKGVGPMRGDLLKKELQIFNFRDLLFQYPYRYIDKTQFHRIIDLTPESG